MPNTISYDPPGRVPRPGGPVRHRHVLYVPGYDPQAKGRARMLFVREFARYAKRFGLKNHHVTRAEQVADLPGSRWRISAGTDAWSTDTVFEVMGWDDIVVGDFQRSIPLRVALLFVGVADLVLKGVLIRFVRLSWKFTGVILYPAVMIAVMGVIALAAGFGAERALDAFVPMPAPLRALVAVVLAGLVFRLASPLFGRWFVWHLLHDWVFNWQHGNGRRADYEARVERFASHLVDVARRGDADEILVVGHSSGSIMAAEMLVRALERDPDLARRGLLALLTVGSCIPLVALNPRAARCRAALARLVTSETVCWAEYQAPQDWLNFPGFEPNRDLGLGVPPERCFNPVVRSARFKEIVAAQTYQAILYRPFRMHFQFLMANDHPGEYDFIMMTTGPVALSDRLRLGLDATTHILRAAQPHADPSTEDLIAAERNRVASPPA